jgi:hypothetical protein
MLPWWSACVSLSGTRFSNQARRRSAIIAVTEQGS